MEKKKEEISSLTFMVLFAKGCFVLIMEAIKNNLRITIKAIKKDSHGSLTMALAILMVTFALPSQIIKNYNGGECGLSFLMVALPLSVYLSRACYAARIKVWYIWIPDTLGVIFSVILLGQYILYKFLL